MVEIKNFKKAYSKAIQNGYAAIFAGAGLSKASGLLIGTNYLMIWRKKLSQMLKKKMIWQKLHNIIVMKNKVEMNK